MRFRRVAVLVTAGPHVQDGSAAPPAMVLTVAEHEVPDLLRYLEWAGKYHAVQASPLPVLSLVRGRWSKSSLGKWWRKVAPPR